MHPFLRRRFSGFIRSFAKKQNCGPGERELIGEDEAPFKGRDIKKIRKSYNLSQRCFADMLDISVRTLQNYEIDRTGIPSTARSLFIFAAENKQLFQKYYLDKVSKIAPYMDVMNK